MVVIAKDRQCLMDIAIQVLGSAEGVFALAERNGISITDRLKDGQRLEYEVADIVDAETARKVAARGITPATEIPTKDETALLSRTAAVNVSTVLDRDDRLIRPGTITNLGTQFDSGVTTVRKDLLTQQAVAEVEDALSAPMRKAQAAAANNEPLESESGQAVSSVFSNQFNDTFA